MKPIGTSTSPVRRLALLQEEVETGELDLDLTAARAFGLDDAGGLELDLRVEHDPVVELVAGVEDEALEVADVAVVGLAVVDVRSELRLAVAADRQAMLWR